jgi:L-threonylcarbamoyladenylate synthase
MEIVKKNEVNISEIITALKNGAVLVLPTDTVYGLVCDATNQKAVEKIFEIKQRPKTKSLGVFVKDINEVKKIAVVDEQAEKFLKKNLPGKFTIILKKQPNCKLANLVGTKNTVGIRIIKNKFINQLLKKFGKPLAQTSANISSQPPATKIKEVLAQFQRRTGLRELLVVDAGNLPQSRPSNVVDLKGSKPLTKRI